MSPIWRDLYTLSEYGPWSASKPKDGVAHSRWSNTCWKPSTNAEHSSYEVRR